MSDFDSTAISVDIGRQVRAMREARGMSVRALARAAGLSANALSQIERGRTLPSVSSLYKIAEALGEPMASFFEQGPPKATVVFTKADGRTRVPFPRGLLEGLGGESFAGKVEPYYLTLETGANSGPHPVVHTGHEFVICLRGTLEYTVEDEVYRLEAGDSLLFAAHLHHRWRNLGTTVTNAIFILSGFEEGERPELGRIVGGQPEGEADSV